jgi:hypothetical protein
MKMSWFIRFAANILYVKSLSLSPGNGTTSES